MIRNRGRVLDKPYLVLRFDIYAQITKAKNEDKLNKLRWKYASEYTQFQIDLINNFCSKNFEELNFYYYEIDPETGHFKKYKDGHIFGPYDIGHDMLKDELGLLREHHWMYIYYKVPRSNEKLISFFLNQKFSFNVKTLKTI